MQGEFNVDWSGTLLPEDQYDQETQALYVQTLKKRLASDPARPAAVGKSLTSSLKSSAFKLNHTGPQTGAPGINTNLRTDEIIYIPAAQRITLNYKSSLVDIYIMNFPHHNTTCRRGTFGYYITAHLARNGTATPMTKDQISTQKLQETEWIYMGVPGIPYTNSFRTNHMNITFIEYLFQCLTKDNWNGPRNWTTLIHKSVQEYYLKQFNVSKTRFDNIKFDWTSEHPCVMRSLLDEKFESELDVSSLFFLPLDHIFSPIPDISSIHGIHHTNACLDTYYEVGGTAIKESLQRAEALDFDFAILIQGLLGLPQESVWACLDPDYNPLDRDPLIAQFRTNYTQSMYKDVNWQNDFMPKNITEEVIDQHKKFAKEWVFQHFKNITPLVTSAAQALALQILPHMRLDIDAKTFTRFLMRHPCINLDFATCLQSYMTSLETARPNRNPSYKQITNSQMAHFQAFKIFTKTLTFKIKTIRDFFTQHQSMHDVLFNEFLTDWYCTAKQLPHYHRYYPRPEQAPAGVIRPAAGASDAPWMHLD